MHKVKKLVFILPILVIGCNEPKNKWSDMFLEETPKLSFQLKNCTNEDKYLDKPVETTYDGEKVKVVGISRQTCETDRKAVLVYSQYYALINNQDIGQMKFYTDKIRILSPAYMTLNTGNNSYYDDYLKAQHSK